MASYTKINDWILNAQTVANVATDQFVVALSNTAPGSESTPPTGDGDGVLANITEVSHTSGTVGPFRYVYVYDDTPTSPADPLVAYFDYGSSITLAAGETIDLDFDNTNGLYQAA